MRFAIATGILAVTLPSDAHLSRKNEYRNVAASGNREGLGDHFSPHEADRMPKGLAGQRRLRTHRRNPMKHRRNLMKNRGILLKNDDGKNYIGRADVKECKAASFDVDVGVLGCGFGQYCKESAESKLGGICASSTLPVDAMKRHLDHDYDDYGNYGNQLSFYCDELKCDCSSFNTSTSVGTITCGPVYECYEACDPLLCLSFTETFESFGGNNYSALKCFSYSSSPPNDRTICFSYSSADYTNTNGIEAYIGEVKCNSFTFGDSDYDPYCYLFDCTNTPADISSSSCDDGVYFLPDAFYSDCTTYTSRTLYQCNVCELGSYSSLADGMIGLYTCGEVELGGQFGLISPDDCRILTPLFDDFCGCQVAPTPENDLCTGAIPLGINSGEMVQGTNKGASPDEVSACFFSEDRFQGVWYTILGDGTNTAVSLCDGTTTFDTEIQVFQGTCTDILCVGTNDDGFLSTGCNGASDFSWFAEAGTVYYILVHGYNGAVGDFTISSPAPTPSPTSSPTVSASPTPSPPDNDRCDGATLLGSNDGQLILGSTAFATPDEVPVCFFSDILESVVGVWYIMIGTGEATSVNLCEGTTYDTVITIYEGSCGNLFCIGRNDDSCDRASEYSWFAEAGTTYYILVHGYSGDTGDFGIRSPVLTESPTNAPTTTFSPTPARPDNDLCEAAVALELNSGELVMGTTISAISQEVLSCDTFDDGVLLSTEGVWYTVLGGDVWTSINLCEGTTFDTIVTVFEGSSCGDLVCIGENDDANGQCDARRGSEFSWFAESGSTYYIFVHGFSSDQGNFGIKSLLTTPAPTVSPTTSASPTAVPPENDVCSSAVPLELNGGPVFGSTLTATMDDATACFFDELILFQRVWYTLTVDDVDTDVFVHLCDEATTFDTKITLYEGSSCDGLVCVDENDIAPRNNLRCGFKSALGWRALAGQTYYIAVHGFVLFEQGDFVIQVVEGFLGEEFANVAFCPASDFDPSEFCNCESDCEEDTPRCQCEDAESNFCCGPQPSGQPSETPTSTPSALPTPEPSGHPSASPTASPSAAPTDKPSVSPSESPTPEPKFSFVVSDISEDTDWCLTATRTKENANMGFRPCDYDGKPSNQQWKFDNNGQLVSKIDESRCVQVGFGTSIFRGIRVRLGSCDNKLTKFAYNPTERYIRPQGGVNDLCVTNRGGNPHSSDTIHVQTCLARSDFMWDFVVAE